MKKQIAAIAENDEERRRLEAVCDRLTRAEERQQPTATCFLSAREQALVRRLLPNCRFFGGTEGAERAVAYYLPEYLSAEEFFDGGPITCLRASFYEENSLTHRDILGALMGAGIRRETVGDICIHGKTCDIFVLSELKKYLLDNLTSAGRMHLSVSEIPLSEAVKPPQTLHEERLTAPALRLDAVISAAFHISRSRAAALIVGGAAAVNCLTCLKPDKVLAEQDELSLRGFGKLRLRSVPATTRKGRLVLIVDKYA